MQETPHREDKVCELQPVTSHVQESAVKCHANVIAATDRCFMRTHGGARAVTPSSGLDCGGNRRHLLYLPNSYTYKIYV